MKSKKLISLLCAAAMTVSSFAGLTITASAAGGDKIGTDIFNDDFNSYAVADLADGTNAGEVKKYIPVSDTDPTDETVGLQVVTTNRGNGGDRGWYTDDAGTLVKTGSYYAIEQKAEGDNYLHMSWPFFGDYLTTNKRWAHVDFTKGTSATSYAATVTENYVVEFDAKFINGMIAGNNDLSTMTADDAAIANPVLRLGKFDGTNTKAVDIDKKALNLGDDWVHIKTVTSVKGTKVFVGNDMDTAVVNTAGVTELAGFGLYTGAVGFNSPPLDVKGDLLKADKHRMTPAVDIDNLKIYKAEPEVEVDVTINFKDEAGEAIKTAVTAIGNVGKTFKVPENYKALIDAEGDNYYKYKSGADDITVAASDNVINLVFESIAKPTVTFKATTGDSKTELATIGTAKAAPGAKTAEIYAQEYIQADGKWYQKVKVEDARKNASYGLIATAGDEDSTVTVDYMPANNVVSFMEAEDMEGTSDDKTGSYDVYSANYPKSGASGGKRVSMPLGSTKYADGFKTAPVATAGKYTITVAGYDSAGKCGIPVSVLASTDADLAHATKIGEVAVTGMFIESFTAELEEGNCFYVGKCAAATVEGKNDLNAPVDYIVVKDATKKADTDPVVTVTGYANKKVSLTSDKDRAVKAVLIHASYASTGVLNNIVAHDVTIASGTTPTDVTIEEAVYAGDKFMVWDSLSGMVPYLATPYTVTAEQGDSKPKFTVTVADTIANGTVVANPTEAEQGDTVTLTVTPATGYKVDTVKVDNDAITATNGVYSFAMPAKNVTVTATFVKVLSGTVTIAGPSAEAPKVGDTLTATVADLPSGATAKYQWQLAKTQDGEFTNVNAATSATKVLSTVSKDNYVRVVVTADDFDGQLVSNVLGPVGEAAAPIPTYAITTAVDPADTATVTTTVGDGTAVTKAMEGVNVTVNATATGDNVIKEIVVTETDGGAAVTFNNETKAFAMPAKAVTVTVKTAPLFAITKATPENGTFNVSAEKAAEGTTVNITDITPADGYKLDTVKFDDTVIEAVEGAYSFTMPAKAVTVTVTFTQTSPVTLAVVGTYVNVATDEATTDHREENRIIAGTKKISGGNLLAYNAAWGEAGSAYGILSVDASKYAGKVRKATLKVVGSSAGNKTDLTAIAFSNYIDFAATEKINGTNINELKGTVVKEVLVGNVAQSDDGSVLTTLTADITDVLRSTANGKLSMALATAGRLVTVNSASIEVAFEDEVIPAATAKVHTVYEDENGTIEIGTKKYSEFGSVTEVTGLYQGDEFTPTVANATIDDKDNATAPAYYSGGTAVKIDSLVAGENNAYITYAKTAYATTTFTAKIGETAKAGAVIKVTGTPTDTTAAAVDTTVTTGDDGTATIKLLPGTYKYSVAQTTEYLEVAETAVTVGENNDVALTANSKQATKITVKYMVSGTTDPVKTAEITDGVYVGESYTVADTYKAAFNVADETAGTFKRYTFVSGDMTVASPVATNNDVVITVATDGLDYYFYNDYEGATETDWTSGDVTRYTTAVDTVSGNTFTKVSAVSNGNNGTTIMSPSLGAPALTDAVIEFDMALTAPSISNSKCSDVYVRTDKFVAGSSSNGWVNSNYMFKLVQKAVGQEVWTVNGADDITLTNGTFYHFKAEMDNNSVVTVTVTSLDGETKLIDGKKYAKTVAEGVTDITADATMIDNTDSPKLGQIAYGTARYYAGMSVDNVKVYKPVTE